MVTRLIAGELKPPGHVDLAARDWETLSGVSQRAPGGDCVIAEDSEPRQVQRVAEEVLSSSFLAPPALPYTSCLLFLRVRDTAQNLV